MHRYFVAPITLVALLMGVAQVHAVPVGAGFGIPNEGLDTAGGRVNVDMSTSVSLAAGTYLRNPVQL